MDSGILTTSNYKTGIDPDMGEILNMQKLEKSQTGVSFKSYSVLPDLVPAHLQSVVKLNRNCTFITTGCCSTPESEQGDITEGEQQVWCADTREVYTIGNHSGYKGYILYLLSIWNYTAFVHIACPLQTTCEQDNFKLMHCFPETVQVF